MSDGPIGGAADRGSYRVQGHREARCAVGTSSDIGGYSGGSGTGESSDVPMCCVNGRDRGDRPLPFPLH